VRGIAAVFPPVRGPRPTDRGRHAGRGRRSSRRARGHAVGRRNRSRSMSMARQMVMRRSKPGQLLTGCRRQTRSPGRRLLRTVGGIGVVAEQPKGGPPQSGLYCRTMSGPVIHPGIPWTAVVAGDTNIVDRRSGLRYNGDPGTRCFGGGKRGDEPAARYALVAFQSKVETRPCSDVSPLSIRQSQPGRHSRVTSSVSFWPPKPKLLLRAALTGALRAWLGT